MSGPPDPGRPPGTASGCSGEVCLTCSDSAVPARVVELLDDALALADAGAGPEEISVALVTARPGDVVLVHAGEALSVLREPPPGANGIIPGAIRTSGGVADRRVAGRDDPGEEGCGP